MATTSFTLRIDTELKARLEAEAETEDRSSAKLAQIAITEFLERREWKRHAIEEGMADVRAGRLIDGDAVMEWVESWGTQNELPEPTVPASKAV
ncbi:MAG: CopG family ribbon-helix-helix protein [Beijerinckiaceae bacterium]